MPGPKDTGKLLAAQTNADFSQVVHRSGFLSVTKQIPDRGLVFASFTAGQG
jgi:hypothetical protein